MSITGLIDINRELAVTESDSQTQSSSVLFVIKTILVMNNKHINYPLIMYRPYLLYWCPLDVYFFQ